MYIPDNLQEEWKPIFGYERTYEVSNYGRIRGLDRKFRKGKILKPNVIKGYEQVTLTLNKNRKGYMVHRLVAGAFIDNNKNLPQVNHIDGNKMNNRVDNLEWCTAKENMIHSVENYIRVDLKPVDMFSIDGEKVCSFPSIGNASKKTGIAKNGILKCCKGRYGFKTAGGYVWKYHESEVIKND